MTRDANVSDLIRRGSPYDPSHSSIESEVISTVKDRNTQAKLWNIEQSSWQARVCCQALLVSIDSFLRPLAEVYIQLRLMPRIVRRCDSADTFFLGHEMRHGYAVADKTVEANAQVSTCK